MTRDEFRIELQAFLAGPHPYPHLYVWHGEPGSLNALLPAGQVQRFNLFELARDLPQHPFALAEAQELLHRAVANWLHGWQFAGAAGQPILVVDGCELLARYKVGLDTFLAVLTDRTIAILLCSAADAAFTPRPKVPGYARCEPGATLAYLTRLVPAARNRIDGGAHESAA